MKFRELRKLLFQKEFYCFMVDDGLRPRYLLELCPYGMNDSLDDYEVENIGETGFIYLKKGE